MSEHQDLERRAMRAAAAIRAYHAAVNVALQAREAALRAEAELRDALPEPGQIVKTPLGTVERKARPRPRRSPHKQGLEEAFEDLPADLRAKVDQREVAVVDLSNIPSDQRDVVREQADEVKVVRDWPTVAEIEKYVPEGELRDRIITTPPAPADEILLDGVGVDAVKLVAA